MDAVNVADGMAMMHSGMIISEVFYVYFKSKLLKLNIQEPPLHIVVPHDGLFEYANTNIIIQNLASFYACSQQKLGENNSRGIKFFFSR